MWKGWSTKFKCVLYVAKWYKVALKIERVPYLRCSICFHYHRWIDVIPQTVCLLLNGTEIFLCLLYDSMLVQSLPHFLLRCGTVWESGECIQHWYTSRVSVMLCVPCDTVRKLVLPTAWLHIISVTEYEQTTNWGQYYELHRTSVYDLHQRLMMFLWDKVGFSSLHLFLKTFIVGSL